MKCPEARRHVDLFMDGELSVAENMKVLEHLNLCAACAAVYEGEKALRAGLREKLGSERAPAALAARLSRALSEPAVPRRRPWPSLAAAAFFLALLAALVFTPPGPVPEAFAADAVVRHEKTRAGYHDAPGPDQACVCRDCSDDPATALRGFFGRHVGHDVCLHDLSRMGYEFVGGAVAPYRGRPVCWTLQRDPRRGVVVSHALLPTDLAGTDRRAALREDGRTVVFVPQGSGLTCVFVFDDEKEASPLKEALGIK